MTDPRIAKIIDAYAHDVKGLTLSECLDTGFSVHQCGVLSKSLGKGKDGYITNDEYWEMRAAGFTNDFIYGLTGNDGNYALNERIKWFGGKFSSKFWPLYLTDNERNLMFWELRRTGQNAQIILPLLIEGLKNGDDTTRAACADALGNIGPENSKVVKALADCIGKHNRAVTALCALSLQRFGADAVEALPALIEGLKQSDFFTVQWCCQTLGKIGHGEESVVPALIDCMKRGKNYCCATTLGEIGAGEAVPDLIDNLNADNPNMRAKIAVALSKLGHADETVFALINGLDDADHLMRSECAWALGLINSPNLIYALPDLDRLRKEDPSPDVRYRANETFEKIAGY